MQTLYGGQPGTDYDDTWWAAVRTLYDEAFPGLPDGIDLAAAAGVRWAEVTTPFALFEDGRCLAHVGVITHPMRIGGADLDIAGIHAVCTTASHRRQGLCRRVLGAALSWADTTHALAKLHTDDPGVYTGQGFRIRPTFRFASAAAPAGPVRARKLAPSTRPEDAALLADLLARRAPVSQRCATRDPGWMVTIDAALSRRLDTALWHLPDHDAIVCFDSEDSTTLIVEVIAPVLPPAAVVRAAAPDPSRPAQWTFPPDLLEPGAVATPAPAAIGVFMTRGDWPDEPVGISPLWEH